MPALRPTRPTPWHPITDPEWAALAPLLRRAAPLGRPPKNLRATWDAIFWVACSKRPWRDLPQNLGRADSAHRTLRRAADSGLLDRLLTAVAQHPKTLAPLEWRIVRAWRRAARVMSMASLSLAQTLGLASALPAPPDCIPDPTLSESITRLSKIMLAQLPHRAGQGLFGPLKTLIRAARGNPRRWRLTA